MTNNGGQHLTLEDVVVTFDGFRAVDGLSLSVSKGELRCIIGPNGAGKTTALDTICGKTKPTAGTITFEGARIDNLEEHQIARAGIGRKFQVPSVFGELTVLDNLEVARSRRHGVMSNAFRFRRGADREELESLAELVGLQDHLTMPARHLSHGQTQWLEIALLVAQDPELILMDEPTAGMTVQETSKTAELFRRLTERHTLIVVEHDMSFVKEIGDVISVMHQGRLLAEGSAEEISGHAEVKAVYLGSGGMGGA